MNKAFVKRYVFALLCTVLICLFPSFSQNVRSEQVYENINTCESVYNLLKRSNLNPRYQNLSPADGELFPRNIIVTIPGKENQDVIFAFTQSYAKKAGDRLIEFCRKIEKAGLPFNTIIFLSAGDDDRALLTVSSRLRVRGTDIFTKEIEDADRTCAIVVTEKSPKAQSQITSGSRFGISPSWLVRILKISCARNGVSVSLPRSFGYLYETGVFSSDQRLSNFLRSDIASASIELGTEDSDFQILETAAFLLSQQKNKSWDRHFAFIPVGTDGIWPGEAFYVLVYILFTAGVLFNMCFFTFLNRRKKHAMVKDFVRSVYVIPALIILGSLLLELFQIILVAMNAQAVFIFGFKVIFTSAILELILLLQLHFQFRYSYAVTGMQMLVVSTINLLLFCAVNISLVFIFFAEYMIVWFCSKTQKPALQITGLLLMFLPFLYFYTNILAFSEAAGKLTMAESSYFQNLMLSGVLFPFLIQWQRIIYTFDVAVAKRVLPVKKIIWRTTRRILITGAGLAVLFFVSTFIIRTLNKNTLSVSQEKKIVADEASESFLKINVTDQNFMDMQTYHLFIKSDKDVYRYVVNINSDQVPLFESNYNYELLGNNNAAFLIPDFPKGELEIIYSCTSGSLQNITVDAYYTETDSSFLHERKTWSSR